MRAVPLAVAGLTLLPACLLLNPGFDGAGEATTAAATADPTSTSSPATTDATTAPPPDTTGTATTAPPPDTTGTATTAPPPDTTGTATTDPPPDTTGTATTDPPPDTTGGGGDEFASTGDGGDEIVLKATKKYDPTEWFHGALTLEGPHTLELPPTLTVTVGNAGNHQAYLFHSLAGVESKCTYRGGSSQSSPPPQTDEWDKGLVYQLLDCDGAPPPMTIEADALRLEVANGHSTVPVDDPRTTVVAVLSVQ